jgi:GNAT superfamily N-acetyltransferase
VPRSTPSIAIRPVTSEADLEALFRFRYEIYVEEMHRCQRYADHKARWIRDPLDDAAIHLAAFSGRRIVGAVRVNFTALGPLGDYERFYDMAAVGSDHPARTSINTRFMIAPEFRGGLLAVRLAMASYAYGAPKGIRWNFIDCNSHLIPFFAGLGYVEHIPPGDHPEYGRVTRMRLAVSDRAHLEAVKSPFLRLMRSEQSIDHGSAVV